MTQKSPELTTPIRSFSIQLSSTPRGARLARLLATEQLRSWGLPLDPARQVIAELSTNAAQHGRVPGRDFRLLLYVVADTLRIEVTDTRGDLLPTPQLPVADSESGRGLLLVDTLADRWESPRARRHARPSGQNSPSDRSPTPRAPVPRAVSLKDHEEERTPPSPTPPARAAASLTRVNISDSAGSGSLCLPYAQRNTPQTCDGPRRDGNPSARA